MGGESPRTQFSDGIATSVFKVIASAMHGKTRSRQRSSNHSQTDSWAAFIIVAKTRDILEAFDVGLQKKFASSISGTD